MLKNIVFYDDRRGSLPDLTKLSGYISKYFPGVKQKRQVLFSAKTGAIPVLAKRFLSTKVIDINKKVDSSAALSEGNFLPPELDYEIEMLANPGKKAFGVIYDGYEFLRIFMDLIPANERNTDFLHIVITNRLLGTFSDDDKRYHLRTGIYSASIAAISVPGIVEAPARPRGYYVQKIAGASPGPLKKEFGSKFIDYGDTRLSDVAKGLVMQAVFYHLTGEPFCENKKCRFYNAHWQEELIDSQVRNKQEFCSRHLKLLKQFGQKMPDLT